MARILTLSDCPPLRHQGSGYVIVNFDEQLRKHGHNVELVGPDELVGPSALGRKGRQYRLILGMAGRAVRAARAASADVLHMYGEECWLACALVSKRKSRPWLVHHSNGVRAYWQQLDPAQNVGRLASRLPYHKAFTHSDLAVTVSDSERRFLIGSGRMPADRVLAIPNSLEPQVLARPLNPKRIPTVLFVGSWIERKGIGAIYRDMPAFLDRHPTYRFRAIGLDDPDAVLRQFSERLRSRLDLEKTSTNREYVYEAMSSASLQIVPSLYESFGLVTAEAMACGAVVVATPIGFAADFSDEKDIFVVGPGEYGLLDALERAMAKEPDWAQVQARAYDATRTLRWESAGKTLSDALNSRVSQGTPPSRGAD